jgi:hypothetical protein
MVRRLTLAVAPTAVALSAILAIYIPSGSPLEGIYRAVAVAAALTIAVEFALSVAIGLGYAAAVTTALVLLVFKERELLIGMAVLSTVVAGWWWWRRRTFPAATMVERLLPPAAALVLAVTTASGVLAGAIGLPTMATRTELGESRARRDIIVVLLDGYPRSDTLVERFGYDNGPFLAELERRGFDVAEKSRSNYALTALTFVSMFQMRHVPDIPRLHGVGGLADGYRAVTSVLAQPQPAIEAFRRHGFEAVAVPAVVNEFRLRAVDRDLDSGQLVQLETVLLGRTLLAPVVNAIAPDFVWAQQRERSMDAIDAIVAAATDERRQFVFAHLMLPHPPFVFGPDGEPQPQPACVPACSIFDSRLGHAEWIQLLREQLEFTNQRLLTLIDEIRSDGADPVIVLLSDHGSRAFQAEYPEEMLLNFFAAATPGVANLFPEDATPINLFPRLLTAYLHEDVALLEEAFYMPDGDGPLQIRRAE